MPERELPIERPEIYRTLLFAFAIWAAHFIASYAAVLIFPTSALARWIAVAALILALAVLAMRLRALGRPRSAIAIGALGIAAAAILFGTLPAIVG